MTVSQSALKVAWDQGVPIPNLFGTSDTWHHREISGIADDHPCTAFFVEEYWKEGDYYAIPLLRDKLESGEWVAIGFRTPRQPGSPLELVPAEVCRFAAIGLEHSSLSGDGLEYVGIRVVHNSLLANVDQAKRRAGRPSIAEDIVVTYRRLLETGTIQADWRITDICHAVRQALAKLYGISESDLRGAGLETVRQTLRPLVDRDKAKKQ